MLRDAASRRRVATAAPPQVIALDDTDNPLDAFASEEAALALVPLELQLTTEIEPAAAIPPEPPRRAWRLPRLPLRAPRVPTLPRLPSLPRLRLPGKLAPAAIAVLTLAALGLPALSFLTAAPRVVPLSGGAVTVTSEPPGRTVRVDGVYRGVTPFATMLVAGRHGVEIGDGADLRVRELHVRPGADVMLHVSWTPTAAGPAAGSASATRPTTAESAANAVPPAVVAASAATAGAAVGKSATSAPPPREPARTVPAPVPTGTLAVTSPFPVRVLVDGVEIGTDSTPRLTIPAGAHTVRLVNERLEFDQPADVTVTARRTHALAVAPPHGTLHINASPWAHVWIDGRRVGDTPIANLTLPIGEHELVLRHPELGEERRTITLGARTPVRVGVELGR